MRLSHWRWLGPIPAAFILQAVFGLQFANGVFASLLNDVTFTQALGVSALFVSLGITAFGILLFYASHPTRHHNVPRAVTALGSLAIAAQSLVAYGLVVRSAALVYLASVLQGTGAGAIYVVGIVVVQDWVPESPGVLTGLSLLFGGAGALFGIYAFEALVHVMGAAIPAMTVASLAAGLVSLSAAMFIERPPTGWCPVAEIFDPDTTMTLKDAQHARRTTAPPSERTALSTIAADYGECSATDCDSTKTTGATTDYCTIQLGDARASSSCKERDTKAEVSCRRLSCIDIVMDVSFALVFVSVFVAAGPGYGFVISYPLMLHELFGQSLSSANQMLCYATFFGIVGRLALGFASDVISSCSSSSSPLSNSTYAPNIDGSKMTNTFILVVQVGSLAVMPVAIAYRIAWLFNGGVMGIFVAFNGGAVVSACLARDVFAAENSTLAFALLGVAVGVGRALFSVVLAGCEHGEYSWYIQVSLVVSIVGAVSSYFIEPSKRVYDGEAGRALFTDSEV